MKNDFTPIQRFIATSLTGFVVYPVVSLSETGLSVTTRGGLDSRDSYLTQTFDVKTMDKNIKTIRMAQGFGAMRGRAPSTDGGDRTGIQYYNDLMFIIWVTLLNKSIGSYLWRGGVEFDDIIANQGDVKGLNIDLRGKRVIDLGTGTGIVGINALLQGKVELDCCNSSVIPL